MAAVDLCDICLHAGDLKLRVWRAYFVRFHPLFTFHGQSGALTHEANLCIRVVHMADRGQWTRIPALLLQLARLSPPLDMRVLARACGLTLVPFAGDLGALHGTEIHYDDSAAHGAQQRMIADGIARWGLRACGVVESDLAVHCVVHGLLDRSREIAATANRQR